jgi:hypothetical protein
VKRATVPTGTIHIKHSFISGEDTWDVVIALSSLLVYWNLFVVTFLMRPEMDMWDIKRSRKFSQLPLHVDCAGSMCQRCD